MMAGKGCADATQYRRGAHNSAFQGMHDVAWLYMWVGVLTLMRTPLRMRMPFCLSFFLGVSLDATTFCCFFWTLSCFLTTSSFSPTVQAWVTRHSAKHNMSMQNTSRMRT